MKGRIVRDSTFDIEQEGDALIFRYGGANSAANIAEGIACGDVRIVPDNFATTTELSWRNDGHSDWEVIPVEIERLGYKEGERRERRSTYVSRDSGLSLLKHALFKGKLKCEACGFVGHTAYGDAIERCFEVHHKLPVSQGKRISNLDDLVLICANCHNAIHGLGEISFDEFVSRFTR